MQRNIIVHHIYPKVRRNNLPRLLNLFHQNIKEWNSGLLLKNELEVIGFYFSNHPITLYPKNYLIKNNIIDYEVILNDVEIKNALIAGSILDIKERSNKEGKKYAFLTVSTKESQIELSIFSDKLSEYRHLIKEGNVHTHPVWRSVECAIASTRRIVRIAEKHNKKAHVLHITTYKPTLPAIIVNPYPPTG